MEKEAEREKKAGRPTTWHLQISAPNTALAFYKALSDLLDNPESFDICHVFSGAKNGGTPVIKNKGKATVLASVISSFLALETGRKQCSTPGCMNPLHYLKASPEQFISTEKDKEIIPQIPMPTGEQFAEIVEYEQDRQDLRYKKPYQFADFRPKINAIDLSDQQLTMALEYLNKQ